MNQRNYLVIISDSQPHSFNIPYFTYLFLKKRTGCFYIVSGLVGAIIMLVADMLARSLVFGAELPLSVLTILFSSPMLLFWMYRQRGSIK